MNPNPHGYGLSLNIDDADNALELDLVRSVAPYFRVARPDPILDQVMAAVATWRDVATDRRLSRAQQDRMAHAFIG